MQQQKQQIMDADIFKDAFLSVVLHNSIQDPVYAEFLLANFPRSLPMNPTIYRQVKNNTNKWMKTAIEGSPTQMPQTIPLEDFANAVYFLATDSIQGSNHFPRNPKRANKFIMILKKLKDERYSVLQKENNQQKRKSLQL